MADLKVLFVLTDVAQRQAVIHCMMGNHPDVQCDFAVSFPDALVQIRHDTNLVIADGKAGGDLLYRLHDARDEPPFAFYTETPRETIQTAMALRGIERDRFSVFDSATTGVDEIIAGFRREALGRPVARARTPEIRAEF